MGWALKNLSIDSRERIARSLFKVENVDGDWLNGLCPFHDDKMPSFGYNRADDVFFCHASCTDSGDLVDLYCLVKGFPIRSREGFLAFKTAFSADWGLSQNIHKTPGQAQRSHTNSGDVETNDALKLPKSAQNENVNAEIPEDILSTLLQIPEDMLLRIEKERGWTPEVIATIGIRVLSHYRRKSSLYTLFPIKESERVAIPIRDEKGTLSACM